jgi:predicted 2-oxoglutarate/Fe(II)-dependent dioxygenase YbiX
MSNPSLFEYKKNEVFQTIVDTNIQVVLKRMNNGSAILFFTDTSGNPIDVPTGLVVYDNTHETIERKIPQTQTYVLGWADEYTIKYCGNVVFRTASHRVWTIYV